MIEWAKRYYGQLCASILAAELFLSPFIYYGVLNYLGPSTQYFEPSIEGATLKADGKYYATVGDRITVRYIVIRNKINGNCPEVMVWRYAENVGGPDNGFKTLIEYVTLSFVGENELLRPRWPIDGLVLTEEMLPPGAESQEVALYVVGRYRCNIMDSIIPRYLQGGVVKDQTPRVNLIINRR